jgi:hypothetical protein
VPPTHSHEDEGDGEFVGDVFEVVADLHPDGVAPTQEMQIVDFTDRLTSFAWLNCGDT